MEIFTLLLFGIILLVFVLLNISIIYALLIGLGIFSFYGKLKGYTLIELLKMIYTGIKTAKNVLIVFVLIGMMTALWRASGTIPIVISYAVQFIKPGTLILMTFLLNCGISFLIGTSFGTAATMGVICMMIAVSMNINPVFVGGAILSGVYFGDRNSPVSTSALLVSELTETNIFDNIKRMLKTALVPFLITCIIYLFAGMNSNGTTNSMDLQNLFSREVNLHWSALIPAIIILILSLMRVKVKIAMSASIAAAIFICMLVQDIEINQIFKIMVKGYNASDPELGAMLNGGGIYSMLKVMGIVSISSSYAGIFQKTGLLNNIKENLVKLSKKITPYGTMVVTSTIAGMIACNQTLTIMLTHQLCKDLEPDEKKLALNLENSAVVIAPLIPWSIAGAVPLTSVGAPMESILAASFLYLIPIYYLLLNFYSEKHLKTSEK